MSDCGDIGLFEAVFIVAMLGGFIALVAGLNWFAFRQFNKETKEQMKRYHQDEDTDSEVELDGPGRYLRVKDKQSGCEAHFVLKEAWDISTAEQISVTFND